VSSSDALLDAVRTFVSDSHVRADSSDAYIDVRRTFVPLSNGRVDSSSVLLETFFYYGGTSDIAVISRDAYLTYLGLPENPSGGYVDERIGSPSSGVYDEGIDSPTSGSYQEGLAPPTGGRRL